MPALHPEQRTVGQKPTAPVATRPSRKRPPPGRKPRKVFLPFGETAARTQPWDFATVSTDESNARNNNSIVKQNIHTSSKATAGHQQPHPFNQTFLEEELCDESSSIRVPTTAFQQTLPSPERTPAGIPNLSNRRGSNMEFGGISTHLGAPKESVADPSTMPRRGSNLYMGTALPGPDENMKTEILEMPSQYSVVTEMSSELNMESIIGNGGYFLGQEAGGGFAIEPTSAWGKDAHGNELPDQSKPKGQFFHFNQMASRVHTRELCSYPSTNLKTELDRVECTLKARQQEGSVGGPGGPKMAKPRRGSTESQMEVGAEDDNGNVTTGVGAMKSARYKDEQEQRMADMHQTQHPEKTHGVRAEDLAKYAVRKLVLKGKEEKEIETDKQKNKWNAIQKKGKGKGKGSSSASEGGTSNKASDKQGVSMAIQIQREIVASKKAEAREIEETKRAILARIMGKQLSQDNKTGGDRQSSLTSITGRLNWHSGGRQSSLSSELSREKRSSTSKDKASDEELPVSHTRKKIEWFCAFSP